MGITQNKISPTPTIENTVRSRPVIRWISLPLETKEAEEASRIFLGILLAANRKTAAEFFNRHTHPSRIHKRNGDKEHVKTSIYHKAMTYRERVHIEFLARFRALKLRVSLVKKRVPSPLGI